jgi:hypothetical protein
MMVQAALKHKARGLVGARFDQGAGILEQLIGCFGIQSHSPEAFAQCGTIALDLQREYPE